MNSTHQAKIVRIGEILPHPNADKLEITMVGGYQVVIGKGNFKTGELAVYIQPDSVVPQTTPFAFIWENYVGIDGTVPEKRRRITVKRLRKEYSEGLLMPVADFPNMFYNGENTGLNTLVKEGDDVATLLGITHYDPVELGGVKMGMLASAPHRRYPKTLRGWFFFLIHKIGFKKFGQQMTESMSLDIPAYDVDNVKNHMRSFILGEPVVVTEKIHGSNARFIYTGGHMYAGSHYQWKHEKSPCVFRKVLAQNPWIEEWCRANEGSTLYGEVVPTQKDFAYGCTRDQKKLFAFDILRPDGTWEKPWRVTKTSDAYAYLIDYAPLGLTTEAAKHSVPPVLYIGPFDLDKIKVVIDGPSLVPNAKNIREGGVISPVVERRVPGLGRLQLKLISNKYLEEQ